MIEPTVHATALVREIQRYNAGRDAERLAMKYARMAQSPLAFLRGSCHLFYDTLPDAEVLVRAPLTWCCGDLHYENFGSYAADNGQVYFDINDYDEAALAPATWDLVRLLTSLQCGAEVLKASAAECLAVSVCCVDAYRDALIKGKALWLERETSTGLVKDLLKGLQGRDRAKFLDRRSTRQGQQRRLKLDGVKALAASAAQIHTVTDFMRDFAATQAHPEFFAVRDIARRIAGTGSLGLQRYIVLVEGKGSPDANYLLDLKAAKPSALSARLLGQDIIQAPWPDEATRVVSVQKSMQAMDHAFLHAVQIDAQPFVLKALQASEDRVAIGDWGKNLDRLKEVTITMGRILAWDQLRAAGRRGAASAEALLDFAGQTAWVEEVLDVATLMNAATKKQYQGFLDGFAGAASGLAEK